jgi:hypothetical protein
VADNGWSDREPGGATMIAIPLEAVEGIDWIHQQRLHNPYNYKLIVNDLRSAGYEETADWIDANYLDYIQGVTQGFMVDLVRGEKELRAT